MSKPSASPASSSQPAAAPIMLKPFTRSSTEHIEPFYDNTIQMTGAQIAIPPQDVPAYGYLRHIVLDVQATGGTSDVTTAANADAPWIALTDVQLADVNGAPLFGPVSGYDLYLVTKYGGYEYSCDPKQLLSYTAPVVGSNASGNFAFSVKLPVEICERDALGSLANQNASSTYKLKLTLNSSTGIYTTPPSLLLPAVRIRAWLEAWAQPTVSDLRGMPQATTPPAHGTSQYWSKTSLPAALGVNTLRLPRVGNYIRSIIFVNRVASTGLRAGGETNWPNPIQFFYDTRLIDNYASRIFRDVITRRTGYTAALEAAGGPDNGVFVWDFCHEFDGKIGRELRDQWLQTVQSTRLEAQGVWTTAACTVDVLTNDVAPAGEVFT